MPRPSSRSCESFHSPMPMEFHFACPLPNGIHARPATALEKCARAFVSHITLLNQRTGHVADSKSILSIIGGDIRFHDACVLTMSGPDEREALAALSRFVQKDLPHCDDTLPAMPLLPGEMRLPRSLRQ